MAIVETRYAVPGWGVGEIWRRDGVLLAHDFRFGAAPDRLQQIVTSGPKNALVERFRGFGAAPDRLQQIVTSVPEDALVERFRGFLAGFDVSFEDVSIDLDWATPLQRALVEALRAVPRGEVVSYGELAALAGRPGAPRAAGALCSANRFAFVVPCHRVVAAHGIGGYGSAGVEVKRRLLALEGVLL